jgi:GTP cyclohydrolase FolE2
MTDKLLPDIQTIGDKIGIAIDHVGVSNLEHQIEVMDENGHP